ncbi:alpha/beta fold hydrolase [Streptomyces sp. NPDC058955]|uniref:alpha/beta fold hydrolase n=1 Tax=unclassified Streptomyces TaxID=2593676 RepID=UPI003657B85F
MNEAKSWSRRRVMTTGAAVAASAATVGLSAAPASASEAAPGVRPGPAPTVVLVHGAFADASSWQPVVERLQKDGLTVRAVANPLRGLATDAAHVRAFLASIPGPVVLVGHSYGGAVITEAAVGAANVKGLVYIAAFVPDAGEVLGELIAKFPGSELQPHLTPVPVLAPDGSTTVDLYLDPAAFRSVFAGDVPARTTRVLAATQRPISAAAFADRPTAAAWHDIPSWNLVATRDRGIPPRLQRFQADRARSYTVDVPCSHLAMYGRPGDVTRLVQRAVRGVG